MCGIAGEVRWRGAGRPKVVEAMLDRLLHRGPDAMGMHANGPACIGQTRLAVIDLLTGDPPITSPDGAIAAVLNGEIYNFGLLRKGLISEGHRFGTSGDTEVLVHLAEREDPVALAQSLDGMFAIALWDARSESLILIRDRLGKKPLYWIDTPDGVVFGSEIKALLAHPAVSRDLDEDAIPAFLHLGYVPTPRTFFAGIHSVPPGHVLELGPDGPPRLTRYWCPPRQAVGESRISAAAAVPAVRQALEAAVHQRLLADVPLGAFLSGGVDSSAVVSIMAKASSTPVRTFTIGFDDADGFDERRWAADVAAHCGSDHTEFVVEPFDVDLVDELVWHHDQPFGDSSAIPMYHLAKLTRQSVTVVLSGDGGDEVFAGYERFAAGVAAARMGMVRRPASMALQALAPLAGQRSSSVRRFADGLSQGLPRGFREWVAYTSEDDVRRLVPGASSWAADEYDELWAASAGRPALDRLLDLNLRTYLLDDLLPKVDRMSMAHGLEVRSPFLDHHLLATAARLHPNAKLRGFSMKRVLRDVATDMVPASVLDRPKHGFGVPLGRWFREDLAGFITDRLGSNQARVRAHVDPSALDRILEEHRLGRVDRGNTIWQLLTLESFLRGQGW